MKSVECSKGRKGESDREKVLSFVDRGEECKRVEEVAERLSQRNSVRARGIPESRVATPDLVNSDQGPREAEDEWGNAKAAVEAAEMSHKRGDQIKETTK